ncbi:M23 family metallopeptidase [Rhodoglobus sp.]
MSFDTSFPQQPGTGDSIPLTRREMRERERAAQTRPSKHSTQQPVEAPAAAPAAPVTATAPRVRKARPSKVKSKRIRVSPATFSASGPPQRRGKALASRALSSVAMLFAGALLVGVSVPSNAFVSSGDSAIASVAPADVSDIAAGAPTPQSLAVSDQVVNDLAQHDDLKVISYAEVLAIQYAGVSYEYRATAGAIRWPFPYEVPITDGFGYRSSGFHKGTDFAAAYGTPIYAIADGVVSYIQADYSGYGYHAIISHIVNGQQVDTLYAHMVTDSSPLVVGDPVNVGDFVGLVGATGISYGAHLHLEIHLDKVPVDPYAWLSTNAVN